MCSLVSDLDAFLLHPSSQVALDGSLVSLQCVTGKSAPPPLVHWEKDGAFFNGGNQEVTTFGIVTYDVIAQKSMRLKLGVGRMAEGVYECVAENTLTGAVSRSDPATLAVQGEILRRYSQMQTVKYSAIPAITINIIFLIFIFLQLFQQILLTGIILTNLYYF